MTALDKARQQRVGLDGYCALLRSVARLPQTTKQLSERFGIFPRTVYWMCASLHRAGLIHRSGWVSGGFRQKQVPLWALGMDGDVDHPHARPVQRKSGSSAVLLGAISEALEPGPISAHQLAEDIGFSRGHMRLVLRTLRKRRLIRIAGWDVRSTGIHVPLLAFGPGGDAARVPKISASTERRQVYRRRCIDKRSHLQMLHLTAAPMEGLAA